MRRSIKLSVVAATLLALCTMVTGCAQPRLQRYGRIIGIKQEGIKEYKRLHMDVPPDVLKKIEECNIRNYSVYLREFEVGKYYLFSYLEYIGEDFEADITRMAVNPTVQKWESLTGAHAKSQRWVDMEEVFYWAGKMDAKVEDLQVQRHGWVIGLRPEMVLPYKFIHKYMWPEVLDMITECNIRNYSIYLYKTGDKCYLLSYLEYIGDDFEADMAKSLEDPATTASMKFTDDVCQLPLPTRAEGEWWSNMEEVFHYD